MTQLKPVTEAVPDNLYNIRCEEGIELLKSNGTKVDCIITSVPYNVDLKYSDYQDNKPHDEYINWLKDIFGNCQDIMTVGSTVAINSGDGCNGRIPTHSDIIQFMTKELNYEIVSTVIWDKKTVSRRNTWGSWMKPSCPSFPTPFEYILLFRYEDRHYRKPNGKATVTRDEFIRNSSALWTFKAETTLSKIHPGAFPEELPSRIIQQMTYEGDLVLDIFSGTGTTAVAAKKLNRRYIGFELSEVYHKFALNRLNSVPDSYGIAA